MESLIDAEKGVLSSLVLCPSRVLPSCLSAGVGKEAFWVPAHGKLFATIQSIHEEGKAVDFITVASRLDKSGELAKVGGPATVSELWTYLPTAANVSHYLDIVAEAYLLRRAGQMLKKFTEKLADGTGATELLASIQGEALALLTKKSARTTTKQAIRDICEEVMNGKDDSALLQTGIDPIDRELRLFRGDYLVIPGPTSSGKSSLACQIALALSKLGRRALIFALEMSTRQVIKRALAAESGHNAENVRQMSLHGRDARGISRSSEIAEQAQHEFAQAALRVSALDFTVIDDVWTLESILATARSHAAEKPLDVLVVDYPALMHTTGNFERRQLALAHAANSFKQFGAQTGCLVITPSQVNKDGGTRECADFEHAANAILSVTFKEDDDTERIVTITKQRDGARGQQIAMWWRGMTTSFIPLEP